MKRKLTSIILTLALILGVVSPIGAVGVSEHTGERIQISDTGYLEFREITSTRATGGTAEYEVQQYENGSLVQTVTGQFDGDWVTVTDYENGVATDQNRISVASRITVEEQPAAAPLASESNIGTIYYNNNVYTGRSEQVQIYHSTTVDNESYRINGEATDSIAFIASLILSVLGTVIFKNAQIATQVAMAIVAGVGGAIVGKEIGVRFSETVAARVTSYWYRGRDVNTGRYSGYFKGTASRITTSASSSYNETFYDGPNPTNWKNYREDFAFNFWADLFNYLQYPGVNRYS